MMNELINVPFAPSGWNVPTDYVDARSVGGTPLSRMELFGRQPAPHQRSTLSNLALL